MMMLLTRKSVFAAALCVAAGSGSLIALATQARAQTPAAAEPASTNLSPAISLSSVALIERKTIDASGKETVSYKQPSEVQVVPGDKVVFKLTYSNKGDQVATGFNATNPMPGAIQFVSVREDWAEVSVDGGKNWGKLADMTVTESVITETAEGEAPKAAEGIAKTITRKAELADVTDVRWVFTKAIAPGATGDISYTGVIK